MKYIYTGYNKCGTKTISAAFQILGYTVYDYQETAVYLGDKWVEFFEQKLTSEERRKLLYRMYKDVDVLIESPSLFYWKELMDVFPESKAVFWQREEDRWFDSFLNQCDQISSTLYLPNICYKAFSYLTPTMYRQRRFQEYMSAHFVGHLETGGWLKPWTAKLPEINEMAARRAYRMHNADFLQTCPKNRRLVLNTIDCGWEPFCKFLECAVPDKQPWPHANKNGGFVTTIYFNDESLLMNTILKETARSLLYITIVGMVIMLLYLSRETLFELFQ